SAGLQPALNDQTRKADCKSALRPLRKILAAGEGFEVLQCSASALERMVVGRRETSIIRANKPPP
ncbi:MAG: hypothetical protein ACYDH9_26205, partial [Limisphaerales bacterium]